MYKEGFTIKKPHDHKALYQRLLGTDFDKLSPNLHHFHRSQSPIRVTGRFKVSRGKSKLTRWFGNLSKLPTETNNGSVELLVTQANQTEDWCRRIENHKFTSKQQLSNGYLLEKFGPIWIYLKAEVNNGDLYIYDHSSTLYGIPFPPFFTPWVKAHGKDEGRGIYITVEVGFFPLGRVIHYQGLVTETPLEL